MTLQLRQIKKCQWNRGWYVQLNEWIKPITLSKLNFKWVCFPRGVPRCSLHVRREWNAGAERHAHFFSCLYRADAESHPTEATESPLFLPLLLQLLQEHQGLRLLLQVLRIHQSQNTILSRFLPYANKWPFLEFFLQCFACATLFIIIIFQSFLKGMTHVGAVEPNGRSTLCIYFVVFFSYFHSVFFVSSYDI